MKYPNGIKKDHNHIEISHARRGMDLEEAINLSNEYYKAHNIALIYKKPTPIKATKISFQNGQKKINEGHFECQSTTDYNGVYKGKYIDFEAKTTHSKTSFPLANIHLHQLQHLNEVIKHHGVSFLIINFCELNKTFLIETRHIFGIIDSRKSIPIKYIEEHGFLIEEKFQPRLDYLKIVDTIIGGLNEKN